MAKLDLGAWIEVLRADHAFMDNVRSIREIPAMDGKYEPFPEWVHPAILASLQNKGIQKLYSHQVEAIEHIWKGNNVVLVTPTASGKTLCYTLPVLQKILLEPETRALYLFPTKALAQDQLNDAQGLINDLKTNIRTYTYDGDTADDARQAIRRQGQIVITNPDMLHGGILPHHTKWQKLFSNLKFVVIDELHIYRGVFGSHLANVIRRLDRIARFYGRSPVYICCSATVANPLEHAENIIEKSAILVANSGAPSSAKTFILYNPPVINRELGIRQSSLAPARKLATSLLDHRIQTIIFTTSRLNVEVLTKYLRDHLRRGKLHLERLVAGYRGGYLPRRRRQIESGLKKKEILAVVSTNALELGIDIGDLDACLMVGYPGSIASTWQQAGRAGRRCGQSLAILIARSTPIDQFIVENVEYFFSQSPEYCRTNPDNLLILLHHIKSAAFELPFEKGEIFGRENLEEILNYLEDKGVIHKSADRWHWMAESYPADEISLRSINPENIVIIDQTNAGSPQAIAEVDWDSAFTTVHEGAIYMLESQQYHVDRLDLERKKAYVRKVDVDYYTDAMTYTNVRVIDVFESKRAGNVVVEHGEVQVVRKVVGYKKIKFYTSENLGYGDVSLPEKDIHTTSYWFTMPMDLLKDLPCTRADLVDGLVGLAYALHHLSAMSLMADIHDLDRSLGDKSGKWFVRHIGNQRLITSDDYQISNDMHTVIDIFDPTIFIYDIYPGGIGFSEFLYKQHSSSLPSAFQLISRCPCVSGCPSCVGPTLEVGRKAKETALAILKIIMHDNA
jgi:DEAD/DEAH box helicase domain-containing protein